MHQLHLLTERSASQLYVSFDLHLIYDLFVCLFILCLYSKITANQNATAFWIACRYIWILKSSSFPSKIRDIQTNLYFCKAVTYITNVSLWRTCVSLTKLHDTQDIYICIKKPNHVHAPQNTNPKTRREKKVNIICSVLSNRSDI